MIAKWLATGILDNVTWNDSIPVSSHAGCLPKILHLSTGYHRRQRDVLRQGCIVQCSHLQTYTTAAQVSIVLNHSDVTVTLSADISLHILRISLGALGWMRWRAADGTASYAVI